MSTVAATSRRIGDRRLLWKAFWLSMLLMHIPAILGVLLGFWSAALGSADVFADIFRLVALLSSAAFFSLKIADVGWLRTTPTWRSRVATVVIVALLHAGLLERSGLIESSYGSARLGLVVLAVAAVDETAVGSLLAQLGRLPTLRCRRLCVNDIRARLGRAFELVLLPNEVFASWRPSVPRAPPLA